MSLAEFPQRPSSSLTGSETTKNEEAKGLRRTISQAEKRRSFTTKLLFYNQDPTVEMAPYNREQSPSPRRASSGIKTTNKKIFNIMPRSHSDPGKSVEPVITTQNKLYTGKKALDIEVIVKNVLKKTDDPTAVSELGDALKKISSSIFKKVKFEELQDEAWRKKNSHINAPNVLALTDHFNQLSAIVIEMILRQDDVSNRKKIIEFFVDVQAYLLDKKQAKVETPIDTHSALAIFSGYTNSAISRLKKTESSLSKSHKKEMKKGDELFKPFDNWKNLDAFITEMQGEGIPLVPTTAILQKHMTAFSGMDAEKTDAEDIESIESFIKRTQSKISPTNDYMLRSIKCKYSTEQQQWTRSLELEPKTSSIKSKQTTS